MDSVSSPTQLEQRRDAARRRRKSKSQQRYRAKMEERERKINDLSDRVAKLEHFLGLFNNEETQQNTDTVTSSPSSASNGVADAAVPQSTFFLPEAAYENPHSQPGVFTSSPASLDNEETFESTVIMPSNAYSADNGVADATASQAVSFAPEAVRGSLPSWLGVVASPNATEWDGELNPSAGNRDGVLLSDPRVYSNYWWVTWPPAMSPNLGLRDPEREWSEGCPLPGSL